MRHFPAPAPAPVHADIDCDTPFTRNLLRTVVATAKAQPDETEAEYNDRFHAVVSHWAALAPRDPLEQTLAAQIVAAHHAALDCLTLAAQADDPAEAGRLQRQFATLNRAMRDTMRVLAKLQERPVASLPPPPVVKPVPPARRAAIAAKPDKPAKQPMQREIHRSPTGRVYDFTRDPAKMDDEELAAAIAHFKGRIAAEEANGIAAETLNSTAAETLNGTAAETLNGKESPHTP